MKVSAFYKAKGYASEFYTPFNTYNAVYASKVFTWSADYNYYPEGAVKGGTGYLGNTTVLPAVIEHSCPDYGLYGLDYSMGFTTRGCIRKCPFCVVPEKEGYIKPHADVSEFLRHKKLVLLDNNILAHNHGLKQIEKLVDLKVKVDFNQGLDARIIVDNPDIAKLLARVKYLRPIRLAMDYLSEAPAVVKASKLLREAGAMPKGYSVYIIVRAGEIDDAIERAEICRKHGLRPFAQPYLDPRLTGYSVSRDQRDLVSWINQRQFFQKMPWKLFKAARHNRNSQLISEETLEAMLIT